jgi:molybdopterin-guanine dinucleotide biosynthesis protein B
MRVIGLAGWSGSGKTTLLVKLIPILTRAGLSVSTIKHAHHGFDIDRPGKDSWMHREAGAAEVLVVSPDRYVLMHEMRGQPEPTLEQSLARLAPVDLVLVEGFKRDPCPRIEIYRPELGRPLLCTDDPWIVAIASPEPVPDAPAPWLPLDRPDVIAAFIREAPLDGPRS